MLDTITRSIAQTCPRCGGRLLFEGATINEYYCLVCGYRRAGPPRLRRAWKAEPDPCRACGSVERWHLADGTERCPVCHPDPRGEMAENVGIERKKGSDD